MTHLLYLFCVLMYILGNALCLFWMVIPALKEKCRIANKKFSWSEWWSCDWNIVIGNMIFGAIVIIALDELIAWKPFVLDYVKWGFGLLGMFGTQLAQEKWGQFKKGLSKLLDVKANISDAVTGKTTDVNDAIIKGTEATNTDVSQTPNP